MCKEVIMKLSIITINFNNFDGLKMTVESVLCQTYRDMEFIIVDGASTDGGAMYVKQLKERTSPFPMTCISEKDTGIYNAMNKGIKRAKGEYLLFLNSGDFLIAPNVIERVFSTEHVADLLCARCNVSSCGKVVWTSTPPKAVTFGTLYYQGLPHQATFIRRDLFDRCGLYREDFKYNSDIAFWYKAVVENQATSEPINIITTDYNLDGISAREKRSEQFMAEHKEILAPYSPFIPDYEAFRRNEGNNAPLYWIRKHKWLYKPLEWVYKWRVRR